MEASESSHLTEILAQQREQRLGAHSDDAADRRERIQRVIDLLVDHHQPIVEAIDADFGGRPIGYSIMNDILGSLASLKHARDHLAEWMRPEPRQAFAPYDQLGATAEVRYQPKGSVGILGTWNAPVFTLISPLAYALAAGNRVVLKPSEVTPRTAAVLGELFAAHIDPREVAVVTGGPALAEAFTRAPFDHLVFTGSTAIGKSVMRNAADQLTPVTLELGGKSPTIIGRSADLAQAAERMAIAKATNAGQICVSADIVYVPTEYLDEFATGLAKVYAELLPDPVGGNDNVSIVDDRHLARIRGYLDDAADRGARIEVAPPGPTDQRHMPLSIVIDPPADALIMQNEIFGPAVVLLPYDEIADPIADINARPNPLALYYFGTDDTEREAVLASTLSGGVTVNDLMMHPGLEDAPFGGVGASGMGHYHGREGFLEFSHARAIFHAAPVDIRREYGLVPPYGPGFEEMMRSQVTR